MRKNIVRMVSLSVLFLILFSTFSLAAASNISVLVNDEKINFDAQPFIDENDRTLIPVRFVSESLGATVEWDQENRKVTIKKDEKIIELTINNNKVLVNEDVLILDTKAILKDSRTFVPVRFISETLGATVNWDQDNQSVLIQSDSVESEEESTVKETESDFIEPDIEVATKGEHDVGDYRFEFVLNNFDDMKDDYQIKKVCTSHDKLNSGYYYDRYEIYGEEGWIFRDYSNWREIKGRFIIINDGEHRIKPNFDESSYFAPEVGEKVTYEIYFRNKNTDEIRKYDVEVIMPKKI